MSSDYEFRADKFAYVALGLPWAVFATVFTGFSLFGDESNHGVWIFAVGTFALVAAIAVFIATYRIVICDGVLTYCRPPWPMRSIRLEEIECARSEFKLSAMRGPYGLIIEPKASSSAQPFTINIKYLSRQNLLTLREVLGDRLVDRSGIVARVTRGLKAHRGR